MPGLLGVELEAEGDDAEGVILEAARALLKRLPAGTSLREVRPDLVSLAEVADKLNVTRQALQSRRMPPPGVGGLYRVDEVEAALAEAMEPGEGRRRPRFDWEQGAAWFRAGRAARLVNARLTTREIDPGSVAIASVMQRDSERAIA